MTRRNTLITVFILARVFFLSGLILFLQACGAESQDGGTGKQKSEVSSSGSDKNVTRSLPQETGLSDETAPDYLRKYARENTQDKVIIHTEFGDITLRLYRNTPMHRANFLYLADQGYFDGTWFYRVSPDHVIQAGNNDDSETGKKRMKIGDYKIPNEIKAGNLHSRGALAAARTYYQNPEKKSNPYEFYIVLGKSYTPRELELLAEKEGFGLTEKQKKVYAQFPGSPHLDEEHTVFGEVIEGMDVVRAISEAETDNGEWPLENIPISVKVLK